jgi:Cytochrome c7 and related cytochrome c
VSRGDARRGAAESDRPVAQIFGPHFDLVFRLSLITACCGLVGLIAIWRLAVAPAIGAPIEQPVPFSHKHHVGDVGLDCRYCHATVDRTAYAGMPSSETCMNCHSQLFTAAPMLAPVRDSLRDGKPLHWNRVNRLPDFVYFDHSAHVANGVDCVNCHGDVSRMPLTMQTASLEMRWCLDCHRHPEQAVRTDLTIANAKPTFRDAAQLSECSTCHR